MILSLFPGIGLLDRAFEEEGFCVVRGPDVLWGGDVKRFHPPAGKFDGVIGGPPCQCFSVMRHLNPLSGQKQGNLIPEYERCVAEAQPAWFLMENVEDAPVPKVDGYKVVCVVLNNRHVDAGDGYGAEQQRVRRFSFGTRDGRSLEIAYAVFERPLFQPAVTASSGKAVPVKIGGSGKVKSTWKPPTVMAGHGPVGRREGYEQNLSLERACELQGLPIDFLSDAPFTVHGKRKVIGNGVPLPMGRAIARAVKCAIAEADAA